MLHMVDSDAAWVVPVIFDGAGHKTVGEAWSDFAKARGVQMGYLLVFKFLGDGALVGRCSTPTSVERRWMSTPMALTVPPFPINSSGKDSE